MSEVAWNFISAIYKSYWDKLVNNKDNRTFRQQVMSKFTLKIYKTRKTTKDDKIIDKPVSFTKLLSPILIKTPKEVNKISKFLNKNAKLTEKKNIEKLYIQASLPKTSKILKIKETFSKLQVNKIIFTKLSIVLGSLSSS